MRLPGVVNYQREMQAWSRAVGKPGIAGALAGTRALLGLPDMMARNRSWMGLSRSLVDSRAWTGLSAAQDREQAATRPRAGSG